MIEFKNGENVIEILKHHNAKVFDEFYNSDKSEELTDEEEKSTIKIERKKIKNKRICEGFKAH